ncbi:hypothetical protein VNO78_20715 [Psophocarpus tetragonolobus]|uniref:Uncharacterized protein n=1 Tax=Psophocarpus tetragonolobus TaxID=3891 RepID=A0AAN9SAW2_PSOTE
MICINDNFFHNSINGKNTTSLSEKARAILSRASPPIVVAQLTSIQTVPPRFLPHYNQTLLLVIRHSLWSYGFVMLDSLLLLLCIDISLNGLAGHECVELI